MEDFRVLKRSAFSKYFKLIKENMHKVFISYYHKDDEYYKNRFDELFGHLFIGKSVEPGDIDTDVSTEYIKRLIQEDYLKDASVLIVLVGQKTYCRKHVDWEISAAIGKEVGGHSGLLGLLLPTYPGYGENKYDPDTIPARLNDNLKSEYAKLYKWTENGEEMKRWTEEAFENRINEADSTDNSSLQLQRNLCE